MSFQLPASSFQKMRARFGFLLKADSWQLPVRRSLGAGGKATGEAGFTLIELLVVTGIIVVVSAVVLANQNRFGGQVLLQNFAYDVALSIRQAQVYGLAVVGNRVGTSPTTHSSYGIHFDISTPATNNTYDLFSDYLNENGVYDCDDPNSCERVQTLNIKRGYVISDLCITRSLTKECHGDSVNSIDIIFQRPEPDAKISWTNGNTGDHNCFVSESQCADKASITLKSPRGDTMSVTVDNNGQIEVDQKVGTAP